MLLCRCVISLRTRLFGGIDRLLTIGYQCNVGTDTITYTHTLAPCPQIGLNFITCDFSALRISGRILTGWGGVWVWAGFVVASREKSQEISWFSIEKRIEIVAKQQRIGEVEAETKIYINGKCVAQND